ncbi:hypothetical protein LAZ40_11490 [Cereibacter sphaeroides]|uniref:hypothetical protein n=1 Tax=Cereibacter sphaeroides TaxID=1063 RepID=UPI001F1AC831|nr:hypothetical protein [Cereibacter sphaeroides]MCE6959641.1 hypothetical protein [Cereibacter sphaeroides]MCE6974498.1 hypothetical protein [Cereibacter sphaeroides]
MEPDVVPLSNEMLAAAHRAPLGTATGAGTSPDSLTIRYDGRMRDGEPVVYAVIAARDLAMLPDEVTGHLGLDGSADRRGTEHAFFVKSPSGLALYVDTNHHEDFLPRLVDACEDRDIGVLSAAGDLRLMMDRDGQLTPPDVPAFIENGSPVVSIQKAVITMLAARLERQIGEARKRLEDLEDDLPSLSQGH